MQLFNWPDNFQGYFHIHGDVEVRIWIIVKVPLNSFYGKDCVW